MFGAAMQLRCTANRAYVRAGAGGVVFVAVDLLPPPTVVTQQNVMNIALAIDCSGSMDGEKIEQAKESALSLVSQLNPGDWISVVSFSDKATMELPTSTAGNRQAAEAAIRKISVLGGTNLYDGLELAFQQARTNSRNAGTVSRIILVTDGMPTEGRTEDSDFVRLARKIHDSGITVTTIGIGDDYNETLLTQIAQAGGGLWYHVKDPRRDLPNIFHEQVTQMAGTVVANPELKLQLMPGAELADAYSVRPMLTKLPGPTMHGGAFVIPLRDLIAGQEQNLVFRIGVPGRRSGRFKLLHVELGKAVQDVVITFTDDSQLWKLETNPYPRLLLASTEGTVLMRTAIQTQDQTALRRAETLLQTIARDPAAATVARTNPVVTEVVTTLRDAHATVVKGGLSESQKKDLLHGTTIIGAKKS